MYKWKNQKTEIKESLQKKTFKYPVDEVSNNEYKRTVLSMDAILMVMGMSRLVQSIDGL